MAMTTKIGLEKYIFVVLSLVFAFLAFDSLLHSGGMQKFEQFEVVILIVGIFVLWWLNQSFLSARRKSTMVLLGILLSAVCVATASIYIKGYQSFSVSDVAGSWPVMTIGAIGLLMVARPCGPPDLNLKEQVPIDGHRSDRYQP